MERMDVEQTTSQETTLACIICKDSITEDQESNKLTERGCATINGVSAKFLDGHINAEIGDFVHAGCRKAYTKENIVFAREKEHKRLASPKKRRPERGATDYSEPKCFLCGQPEKLSKKGTSVQQGKLIPVRTTEFQDSVLRCCSKRGEGDCWARDVKGRIEYFQDLFAKDAMYHNVCFSNFRSGFRIPKLFQTTASSTKSKKSSGRPENKELSQAFFLVIEHLDNVDYEQLTMSDLLTIMRRSLSHPEKAYSKPYMKKKLQDHYGEKIMFLEDKGIKDIICLKQTADSILRNYYNSPKSPDPNIQKKQLIETAAQLIKNDIKEMGSNKDTYPEIVPEDMLSYLPDSLVCLLTNVCQGKNVSLKLAAIGQALVQCARPKTVLAPLQFGLGVQLHKVFASRFLIDTLNHLGFSCSYSEVRKFRMNAVAQYGIDLPTPADGETLQFVGDNVDHNTITLDGRNTFHGMGIIGVITPGGNKPTIIPRRNVKLNDVKDIGRIGIYFYRSGWKNLSALCFKHLPDIPVDDPTAHLETLWKISWPLRSPRPSWKGMMQMMHAGDHPGSSAVFYMPMIDLNPGDMSCVYSTLKFATKQALNRNVVPIITFDQPLYMKALTIISSECESSELKDIVLRLGTFHMQMSFLGCIGYIMAGSGLHEVLELLFAKNAVTHMVSGKAYDRAVRGYILIYAALYALLTAGAFQMPWLLIHHPPEEQADGVEFVDVEGIGGPDEEGHVAEGGEAISSDFLVEAGPFVVEIQDTIDVVERAGTSVSDECPETEGGENLREAQRSTGNLDLDNAMAFLEQALSGDMSSETHVQHSLEKIHHQLEAHKKPLLTCRTSKLWLQFLDMVHILLNSIKAERTGNFLLHLRSVKDMLPYFAACGHNNYLKSAWMYLQEMLGLKDKHNELYQRFLAGHHCVRRSDRYWAGLSSDLLIEQTLMRSLKTNGGLTRGSGMGPTERLLWLLGMPASAHVNTSMQLVTGVEFATSEQHKDCSHARQVRDHADTLKLIGYFLSRNPFDLGDNKLRDLSSGREFDEVVNVESAQQIGQDIVTQITGRTMDDVHMKKSDQAVTMATKTTTVFTNKEPVAVDPNLLFQRLTKIAQVTPERLPECFEFELSPIPTALFDKAGLPREARKHELAKYIWAATKQDVKELPKDVTYVLDGGALLYSQTWSKTATFVQLIACYVDFVIRHYGRATVVFDGYGRGPSTKDAAHLRRKNGLKTANDVQFEDDMFVADTREAFLKNEVNKQRFINRLSKALEDSGIEVIQEDGDADCCIARTVLQKATAFPTTLVANDTDLLILLLYHTQEFHRKVYMAAGERNWDIKVVQTALNAECTDLSKTLLFCHGFGGCDTTSGLHSIGKGTILKKSARSSFLREQSQVYETPQTTCERIIIAGEKAMAFLYSNGEEERSLNSLRYVKYQQKLVTSTSSIEPQQLPPTSAAAQFHAMRSYYQIQEWISLKGDAMDPLEWGWNITGDKMFPIYTNRAPAPEDLLHLIRCTCKTDCLTRRCSCRLYGLPCTAACAHCKGESCFNSASHEEEVDDLVCEI